jgi:hypothetical protein
MTELRPANCLLLLLLPLPLILYCFTIFLASALPFWVITRK